MKDKDSIFKEYILEIVILFVAVFLTILNPQRAELSLIKAFSTYINLLLVIISVAFLSGFISEVVSKETIKKFVGKESGFRGVLLGAIFGTLMVGPAYAFFPFFKEMINKGAKVRVIATTMGAWAIKLPWIPFAVAILGWKYVLLLNLFVFIYAILSGLVVEYFITHLERRGMK